MKLSEAILLGSVMSTQTFGVTFSKDGSCAWGAALSSINIHEHSVYMHFAAIRNRWAWSFAGNYICPCCNTGLLPFSMIIHLNDGHRWTRPQIAAWVATIEPQEVAAAEPITESQCVTRR